MNGTTKAAREYIDPLPALYAARQEIEQLRRQNEILRAKVEVIELMDRALRSRMPNKEGGYAHPDPLGQLNEIIFQEEDRAGCANALTR